MVFSFLCNRLLIVPDVTRISGLSRKHDAIKHNFVNIKMNNFKSTENSVSHILNENTFFVSLEICQHAELRLDYYEYCHNHVSSAFCVRRTVHTAALQF